MKTINLRIEKAKKCNGDYSVFAQFDYDMKVIDVIRSFSSKYWDAKNKEWEFSYKNLNTFVHALQEYTIDIVVKEALDIQGERKIEIPNGFKFKTKPFEHQLEGFEYGLQHDRWLLGDEQGLGKTKQVIDIAVAKKLQKGYKHCLIICGVNGLKWNWVNEIHTHSNEEAYILGQRTKRDKITVGGTADKLSDLERISDGFPYFLITNVESLRDEKITAKIADLCKKGIIGIVAADEVHRMKNPSSQQGKGFLKINSECKIAMTGTPLMNNPLDLYIILKWLGYEKHAFYSFKQHYCVMGGYGGYEIIGYKNLEELREQLENIMLRRLKSEVLDLPEKTYVDEYVEMTAKQAQIYKETTMEIQTNIDMIKASSNPLASLIRMRQATGYTGILSSTIQESAKLDRMEELVDDAIDNGKQVVIFSNWTQITDIVYSRLRVKYAAACITGETKDNERQSYVEDFQVGRAKIIIGTIGAMGTGLNLYSGSIIIFMDHPWTMAAYSQAVDRCHRIGQKQNITIYNLLCKDTIDERIWNIVKKKGAISDAIIDNNFDMTKAELLQYLIG